MIITLFSSLLPIIILMGLGFFARKRNQVSHEAGRILSTILLTYCLPAFLFYSFATTPIEKIWNSNFVVGLLLSTLGTYLITFLIMKRRYSSSISSIIALAVGWPNSVFLGLPLLLFLFGGDVALPIALGTMITLLTTLPLTLLLLENTEKFNWKTFFTQAGLHKNPVIIGGVCGIICSCFSLPLPRMFLNSLRLLEQPTSAMALFATGVAMADYKVVMRRAMILPIVLKNIIQPLIGLGFIFLFHMQGMWAGLLLLSLACPSANTPLMLALKYQSGEEEAVSIIVITTLLFIGMIFLFYPMALHFY